MAGRNLTAHPALGHNNNYTISNHNHLYPAANTNLSLVGSHTAVAAATFTSDAYDDPDVTGVTVMMFAPLMVSDANGTMIARTVSAATKNHTVMVSCVMFGAGVLGNLLALFVLATSSAEQRRSLFYKLVAGLAVTDLLGTVATSPVVIAVYVNNFQWVGGMAMCHYFSFAMIFAGYATMLIVCTMSVERYICVRYPYLYHTRLSGKFAKLALLSCWVFAILIASLPLLGIGTNVKQYPSTWCFFDYLSTQTTDVVFNYIYAILALIAVIVTFVCNVSVIVTLLTLRSRQNKLDASEAHNKRRNRATSQRFAEVQMMVMLIGVTVVFTACFAPLMIFVLLCQTDLVNYIDSRKSVLILIRVASFNPILDPWVYILCRRELVWRIVRVCRCILRLEPLQPVAHQRLLASQRQERPHTDYTNGGIEGGGKGERNGGGGGKEKGERNGQLGVTNTDTNTEVDVSRNRRRALDDPYDPSCLAFCYQCLCLPPTPRASVIMSQSRGQSITMGRSASQAFRRCSSAEQVTFLSGSPSRGTPTRTPSRLVIKPPSPSEQLLLTKLSTDLGSGRSVNSNV